VLDTTGSEETSVLSNVMTDTFVIEHEITFIHSNEVIE